MRREKNKKETFWSNNNLKHSFENIEKDSYLPFNFNNVDISEKLTYQISATSYPNSSPIQRLSDNAFVPHPRPDR